MATYKYCVVPMCDSSTGKYPQKLFFHVPRNEALRKKWFRIMRRTTMLSANSTCYICEDHFDMPDDAENYMKVKLMGGKMYRKKGVFPHIFDCQKDRIVPERPQSERRRRKALVNELLKEHQQSAIDQSQIPEPSALLRMHQSSKTVVEEQDQNEQEKQDNIPVEPTTRIKEEPAADYTTPSTSSSTSNIPFTSSSTGNTPSTSSSTSNTPSTSSSTSSTPFTSSSTSNVVYILPNFVIPWTITSPVQQPQINFSVGNLNCLNVPESSEGGQPIMKQRTNSSLNTTIASASTSVSVSTSSSASTSVSASTDLSNHTAIIQQNRATNDVSTINTSNELCSNPFGSFGNYVANKLNSLDSVSSAIAQKAIERIILEAEMGKYLDQTTQDIKPSVASSSI